MRARTRWSLIVTVAAMALLLIGGSLVLPSRGAASPRAGRDQSSDHRATQGRPDSRSPGGPTGRRCRDYGQPSPQPKHWRVDQCAEPDRTADIRTRFRAEQKYYHYSDVLLVDTSGAVLLSLSDYATTQWPRHCRPCDRAPRAPTSPHRSSHGAGDSSPHLDSIAPVFDTSGGSPVPVGAVSPSPRCDTVDLPADPVVADEQRDAPRRSSCDGMATHVLFLNELRHQKDTALKLRIPLSQTEVPAVMAVLGHEGVFSGKDYRGVEVLSVLKPIPDSSWYIVAKVDTAEALAAWRQASVLIVALILGLVAAGVASRRGVAARPQSTIPSRCIRLSPAATSPKSDTARRSTASVTA